MTTADLLERSVEIAGMEVKPQIGTIDDKIAEIRALKPKMRTKKESELLKIANASKRSFRLINIATAIAAGGKGEDGFPRLAIASYNMSIKNERLIVEIGVDGEVEFTDGAYRGWSVRFPEGTLPPVEGMWNRFSFNTMQATTVVPLVPPLLRKSNPDGLIVLYESPGWKRVVIRPVDPYLLYKIAGNVYAVMGTWDITELELNAYQTARDLGI